MKGLHQSAYSATRVAETNTYLAGDVNGNLASCNLDINHIDGVVT